MAISLSEDFIGLASDFLCVKIQGHRRHVDKHIHLFILLGLPAAKDGRYSNFRKQHGKLSVGCKSLSYSVNMRKGTDCIPTTVCFPTTVCLSFLVYKVKIWVEKPKSNESLMKLILSKDDSDFQRRILSMW